jgi:hypothetical protein
MASLTPAVPGNNALGVLFLTIFTLFWSGFVLCFDAIMLRDVVGQIRSEKFPTTPGEVLRSEVTTSSSRKGKSYKAVIRYRYVVEDHPYESTRLRFGQFSSSDRKGAYALVAQYKAGTRVMVHVNPRNPTEALLQPGLEGIDLFLPMFVTPFNVVMIGLWTVPALWIRGKWFRRAAGGVKIIQDGPRLRIPLPKTTPLTVGMLCLGGLSFAAIFVVGFSTRMNPSLPAMELAWSCVVGISVFFAGRRWLRIRSGAEDLVVEELSRTLILPMTFDRKESLTVAFSDLHGIGVRAVPHRGRRGGTYETFAPVVELRGKSPEGERLADWPNRQQAEDFAAWLRERTGVAVQTPTI